MKFFGSLIGWAIIISLLLLSLTFVDMLALADIHQDYVSGSVLETFQLDVTNELPSWTSTNLEWGWIRISLLIKSILIIIVIVALIKAAKKINI